MAIPEITFPVALDTSTNLYNVADALSLPLARDYTPGDTTVFVAPDPVIMAQFPDTGIITLTENCSPTEYRAVSFYYAAKDNINFTFTNLTVLDETPDVTEKKAGVTKVSMNVTAQHHNAIKNAALSIEGYLGVSSDLGVLPFEGTINGRTNFLLKTVFTPRAWFIAFPTLGKITPGLGMEVTFTSYCLYLGEELPDNTVTYKWWFGDGQPYTSSTPDLTTTNAVVTHIYLEPDIYNVQMQVTNKFGSDTVLFRSMIDALYLAPEAAMIVVGWPGTAPTDPSKPGLLNFPTRTPPYIKAPAGAYIDVYTSDLPVVGSDPLHAENGEYLEETSPLVYTPIDAIVSYTWDLSDTLSHGTTSPATKALYTIGGDYQVVLRVDTNSGAYRITQNEKYINVTERQNAWLFTFATGTNDVSASELGFLNETFKTKQVTYSTITKDSSFLDYIPDPKNKARAINQFNTNNNLNAISSTPSGLDGFCLLSWASGRSPSQTSTSETIKCLNYNGFQETYDVPSGFEFSRPWNWIAFNGPSVNYYILGNAVNQPAGSSPTNLNVSMQNLINGTVQNYSLSAANFIGSADLLQNNAASYDTFGTNITGDYSAYRTALRGRTGYILKNTTVGQDFMIKAFFSTKESASLLIDSFIRLPDMTGPVKTQGQLVNLSTGLFFFNNTGSVMQFDVTANAWRTGGPGYNSITFSNLQDKTVPDYDNENNPLVATTDFANNAFLSFDYSNNAFIKFNDIDLSFSKLASRPSGTQWLFRSY